MRFRMISPTRFLPALLVLAMAANTQAQTNSQNDASASSDKRSPRVVTSRYRFVPTQKNPAAASPRQQLANRAIQFDRAVQVRSEQETIRIAALMPAKDVSTSPNRLNPTVDSAAFNSSAAFEAPADSVHDNSRSYATNHNVSAARPVEGSNYVVGNASPPPSNQTPEIYHCPPQLTYAESFVPMNRNFFGIDRYSVCDEWGGFIACGGLKANPGHYGQAFIIGCDPCEPPCGRCSKCLVEKHRTKHGKPEGCRPCMKSCSDGCDNCASANKKACGIKGRAEKNNSDCGCDSCTASSGGILNWLK